MNNSVYAKANSADLADISQQKSLEGLLIEGDNCPVIQVIGDSTGNDTDEWAYLLGQKIAQKYPAINVKYKPYNVTSGRYDAWLDIQHVAEDRHIKIGTSGYSPFVNHAEVVKVSGDLDIEMHLALDDWQQTGVYLLAKMTNAPHYCFGIYLNSNRIYLYWSEDGTVLKTFNTGIDTTAWVDGTDKWIKITLDVDNGAGGYTATSYTSTDGVVWTQSSTSTIGGATSVYVDSTVSYTIGGKLSDSAFASGKYYEVIIRDGINGANVFPQPIEAFGKNTQPIQSGSFGGTPTVYIYNASISGSGISNWNNSDYVNKAILKTYGALLFFSLGHNDGTARDSAYITALDSFWALVNAKAIACEKILITQNPVTASTVYPYDRRLRRKILMGYAQSKGMKVIDTYLQFLKDSRGVPALLNADGIHPNADGQTVWVNEIWDKLRL